MLVPTQSAAIVKIFYKIVLTLVASICLLSPPLCLAQSWKDTLSKALKNGGAFAERENGEVLYDFRSRDHFIPASTIKLAIASFALDYLGADYRFPTEFYVTPDETLAIKGYGDPLLLSEELAVIAKKLRGKLKRITGIVIDATYFAPHIIIDGSSNSSNPYDAVNGAFLVNFNTAQVRKLPNKSILPGEPQTPLTPLVKQIARNYPTGLQRVNLGNDELLGTRYAGELLVEFLKREDIAVSGSIELGVLPHGCHLLYRHRSSQPLREVIRKLLKYSTNFTANQLFLSLGAERLGPPATAEKGRQALVEFLTQKIGWKDFQLVEGSGLSRKNSVTPRQMIQLLRHFERYRDLLHEEEGIFFGKTGTLTGVNTYSGYFRSRDKSWVRFSILVNDVVPVDYRFRLVRMLYDGAATR